MIIIRHMDAFERKPAIIIRGSCRLGTSFMIGVGRMFVLFIGQAIIRSRKGTELSFVEVQRVSCGTKLNAHMVKMRVPRIQTLTQTSNLLCQTPNFKCINSVLATVCQPFLRTMIKTRCGTQKLIEAVLSAAG